MRCGHANRGVRFPGGAWTDTYAIKEHRRLFDHTARFRSRSMPVCRPRPARANLSRTESPTMNMLSLPFGDRIRKCEVVKNAGSRDQRMAPGARPVAPDGRAAGDDATPWRSGDQCGHGACEVGRAEPAGAWPRSSPSRLRLDKDVSSVEVAGAGLYQVCGFRTGSGRPGLGGGHLCRRGTDYGRSEGRGWRPGGAARRILTLNYVSGQSDRSHACGPLGGWVRRGAGMVGDALANVLAFAGL